MHREETEGEVPCAACGNPISPNEPCFEVSETVAVCWECSQKRGGVYDADKESWTKDPDVSDLPDERRPHP